ncbi:MAG: extracellular solute-binding protein [Clostridia bacterium]|nr:extracellular solute-binding protein [Clostridia bacterium]
MKARKIISLVLALALCVMTLAACGKKTNDKDEQGRTVISVGGWPDKEGTELDNAVARKEAFEKENPDVVIKPDKWKFDLKTFYAKAAGNQLPNYFSVHATEVSQIIDSEYSADVTDALEKYGYLDKMNPDILELVRKDGKIYAIPAYAYVMGVAFNPEMLKAAGLLEADGTPKQPKDWYELAEFAVKIKKATGKPGFVFPTAANNGGWIFNPIAWSFGVDFMEQDKDGKWKATFNTPEAVEALQYIKDLKWKYDVLPANTLIDGTEYYKTFATGNAAMMITAGDYPRKVTQYGMVPDQVGMMGMPAGPKRHVTLMGGTMFAVSSDATEDQIDAAIRYHGTQFHHSLSDAVKDSLEREMKKKLEEGQLVGIKSMSVWNANAESLAYEYDLIDKNANSNPNHVRLYNEFVANCPAEIQPEEPVCAQELYAILDGCIQEVLVNKDADCAELIKKAAADFQANYLDNLTF